jgi:hypothetical protein
MSSLIRFKIPKIIKRIYLFLLISRKNQVESRIKTFGGRIL